jgi:hypothetical protein
MPWKDSFTANGSRSALERCWSHRVALSPASIGRAVFTEECLRLIRGEIRKPEGSLTDEEDLATAIHDMLSTEARERIGPLKIRRKRQTRPAPAAEGTVGESPEAPAPEVEPEPEPTEEDT